MGYFGTKFLSSGYGSIINWVLGPKKMGTWSHHAIRTSLRRNGKTKWLSIFESGIMIYTDYEGKPRADSLSKEHEERYNLPIIKLTEESPSPALNGLTPACLSQSQDAQWRSSNLRVETPNHSHTVLSLGTMIQGSSAHQPVFEDCSMSTIIDPVTTLPDCLNFMQGEERVVFKNAAIMDYYALQCKSPTDVRAKVDYLLKNNHFTCHPSKQEATWHHLPPLVQKKLIEDTKKWIKYQLRENGVTQDHESCTPVEDLKPEGYLQYKVSGDKECESEDNSDPHGGVEGNGLVEGPFVDD
ncbi:hypothetical protein HOY80DRAFT_999717 [Tuber brumale]|nr:hypothetical protein HOY80DRAFT_999717 [Tuber brumale]